MFFYVKYVYANAMTMSTIKNIAVRMMHPTNFLTSNTPTMIATRHNK